MLIRDALPVTMPAVAMTAMVSEATAYRYFPDLAIRRSPRRSPKSGRLRRKATANRSPPQDDPVECVPFATRFLLDGVAERQAVVRAMIAATISRPEFAGRVRPGIRFGLIDYAVAPFSPRSRQPTPRVPLELRRDLAIVVSADALFCLTDLCGLSVQDAIDSAVQTAKTLTAAAFAASS